MIDTTQYNAIGEYVLVEAYRDSSDSIIRTVDTKQYVLEGTVLSRETSEHDEVFAWTPTYLKGDRILFNQQKALKVPTHLHEDIFLVRDEDIFAIANNETITTTKED